MVEELDTLLAIADRGLGILFDGGSTIQLGIGDDARYISRGLASRLDRLEASVASGLAGQPSPDAVSLRAGILLVPQSSTVPCRAWIQFATPRRISAEEMIVADLLAQAFALAVDRVVALERAALIETQLRDAVDNQKIIGQAVGILVERHRILPEDAFDRIRAASQNRNIKLREIAHRMIETGEEPDHA